MQDPLLDTLARHLGICEEALNLAQRDHQALREPGELSPFGACAARRSLLPRLQASLDDIRARRTAWQQKPAAERVHQPEVLNLFRRNQEVIMKILVLERENEQNLLRRGLVPPRHLPPAAQQRPHFVADLYRRNGLASAHAD